MKTVLDSSSLVKRYVEEEGSDVVEDVLAATTDLALCIIATPEIASALNRRRREGGLSSADYHACRKQLTDDLGDATILNLTPTVIARAVALLESETLRAMDSLHIACAIEWETDLFVSSDHRQLEAAQNVGLHVQFIGQRSDSGI